MFKSLLTIIVACCAAYSLAQSGDSFFDSKGVKIRYVTAGQGEPVVLIHGWMADSTMWGKDAAGNPKLAAPKGFQLIAMDCRGHGKSDKPHEAAKYGVEMAEDVVRLLDHLNIKQAHLIGYSMGAFIVGKVAATHPDRALSIVYGGQAPLIVGEPPSGSNEVEIFSKAVDEGKGLGPYLMAVMPADMPKPTLEQASAMANLMYAGKDLKAWALAGRSLSELEVNETDLSQCKAPVLFIYGAKESAYLKEKVGRLRKRLGAEVKVIEGANHVTTLSKPEFGLTILDFLLAHRAK